MNDPLTRSKEILVESQVMLDEHDRKYHPEWFCANGHRMRHDVYDLPTELPTEDECMPCFMFVEGVRKAERM